MTTTQYKVSHHNHDQYKQYYHYTTKNASSVSSQQFTFNPSVIWCWPIVDMTPIKISTKTHYFTQLKYPVITA